MYTLVEYPIKTSVSHCHVWLPEGKSGFGIYHESFRQMEYYGRRLPNVITFIFFGMRMFFLDFRNLGTSPNPIVYHPVPLNVTILGDPTSWCWKKRHRCRREVASFATATAVEAPAGAGKFPVDSRQWSFHPFNTDSPQTRAYIFIYTHTCLFNLFHVFFICVCPGLGIPLLGNG